MFILERDALEHEVGVFFFWLLLGWMLDMSAQTDDAMTSPLSLDAALAVHIHDATKADQTTHLVNMIYGNYISIPVVR